MDERAERPRFDETRGLIVALAVQRERIEWRLATLSPEDRERVPRPDAGTAAPPPE